MKPKPKQKIFGIIAVFLAILAPAPLQAFFEIAEVMPNTTDDKNLEYIVIKNISSIEQNIENYYMRDTSGKTYIFSDKNFTAGEKVEYGRPETKLILNNSNETLELLDPVGKQVDFVEYASTTKGEFLSFEKIDDMDTGDITSDEIYISGEPLYITPEAQVEENNSNEETLPIELLEAPEVVISLQRPSYVSWSGSTLVCDSERDECKVNFDLRDSFIEGFLERDYECESSFGFENTQENRCNPNTITVPQGIHNAYFEIYHEDDRMASSRVEFTLSNVLFQNEESAQAIEQGETEQDTQDSQNLPSGGGSVEIAKTFPEQLIELQQPSYGSFDEDGNFICDPSRESCKVNFDLRSTFNTDFPEKDYICALNFGLESLSGEETKCNPNTVEYAQEGVYDLQFEIYDEAGVLQSTKEFQLIFNTSLQKSSSSGVRFILTDPQIEIQSGLEGSGSVYLCKREDCRVNLKHDPPLDEIACHWDFGAGVKSSESTHTRCNPGFVTYPLGIFTITLKIYDEDNPGNMREKNIRIVNEEIVTSDDTKETNISNTEKIGESARTLEKIEIRDHENNAKIVPITLQGKLGKEKELRGNKLACYDIDRCYVNLISEISGIWNLNGNSWFEGDNPKGIWLEKGKHIFEFISANYITHFYVYVEGKRDSISKAGEPDLFAESEKKRAKIKSHSGAKKQKLRFTLNLFPLKYDGLRISGVADPGVKVELYAGERLLGEALLNEKGRYRFVTKNVQMGSGNYGAILRYTDGRVIYRLNFKNYFLHAEKMQHWKMGKESEKHIENVKNFSQENTKKAVKNEIDMSIASLPMWQHILLGSLSAIFFLFASYNIISLHLKSQRFIFLSNCAQFQTQMRQKVILIL